MTPFFLEKSKTSFTIQMKYPRPFNIMWKSYGLLISTKQFPQGKVLHHICLELRKVSSQKLCPKLYYNDS
jgi:hypothetical protein